MRLVFLILAASFLLLPRQMVSQTPEAPRLPRGSDANDWEAYYDLGIAQLAQDPAAAHAAFTWASRLRPDRSEPLFAIWAAFWTRDIPLFRLYLEGDEKTLRDRRVRQADSLRVRAFWRNPFVHQGPIIAAYDRLPGRWQSDRLTRGWIALGRAELDQALGMFGVMIDDDPKRYGYLRFVRASAFVNSGRPDSAMNELSALLSLLRTEDTTVLVREYQSKELLEYAHGLLHLQRGKRSAAREAFGRAIAENAAFAPAHAKLGEIALAMRDTAAALLAYGMAIELDPSDVESLMGHGRALQAAKRPIDARERFRGAVALQPMYAAPYLMLASVLDESGDAAGAAAAYREFLRRAPRFDPQRGRAEQRVQALTAP